MYAHARKRMVSCFIHMIWAKESEFMTSADTSWTM